MTTNYVTENLMDKPIVTMSGAELVSLITESVTTMIQESQTGVPTINQRYYHGIGGLAQVLGCSVPTANRIKKSGALDGAISQIGRKIIVDGNKALELMNSIKNKTV